MDPLKKECRTHEGMCHFVFDSNLPPGKAACPASKNTSHEKWDPLAEFHIHPLPIAQPCPQGHLETYIHELKVLDRIVSTTLKSPFRSA